MLLQWLAPPAEIKSIKVLGQVEAWLRWGKGLEGKRDSLWQVLAGEAGSGKRCRFR